MPGLHPALGTAAKTSSSSSGSSGAHHSDSLFSSPDGIKGRTAEEKGVSLAEKSGASSQGKSRLEPAADPSLGER